MKKTITLLLTLTLIIGTVLGTVNVNADSSSNLSFKYVITPKSPEWKNFTPVELKKKLNIPIQDAENMDTGTLLNVILDYPFLGDIYAFDDPLKGIDFLAVQFNGLKVLLEREDLKDKLVEGYKDSANKIMKLNDSEKINNEERHKHKYREALLSYPAVFNKLNKTEKDIIVSDSKKVADKIDTNPINVEHADKFGSPASRKAAFTAAFRATLTASRSSILTTMPALMLAAAGDTIRTGYVGTPNFTLVEVFEREEMSISDKNALDAYITSVYPYAIRLRSASYKYNCHSYAWYSTSASNTWWMNNPTAYMTDGSYIKRTTATSGMKAYYGAGHTGIISSVSGTNITVTSKWGGYGLYTHAEYSCPYYSGILNTYWQLF